MKQLFLLYNHFISSRSSQSSAETVEVVESVDLGLGVESVVIVHNSYGFQPVGRMAVLTNFSLCLQ